MPTELRQARLRRSWTQDECADRLCGLAVQIGEGGAGVDGNTVSRWERDVHAPSPRHLRLLCALFDSGPAGLGYPMARLEGAGPETLRVALAVVTHRGRVLLVLRRQSGAGPSVAWGFPTGIVKPGMDPAGVAVSETLAETGVHCVARQHLGGRVHPLTRAWCDYFACDYLCGEAANGDPVENASVEWVDCDQLARFILRERIFPPVLEALEGATA